MHQEAPSRPSRTVAYVAYGLFVLILWSIAEVGLAFLPSFFNPHAIVNLFYIPPNISPNEYEHYLSVRDPNLGWPSPLSNAENLDATGARISPAFSAPGTECVSLYGDSFTFGSEVNNEQAWGNLLALELGCRVANFGVGGYGTDQSVLRFSENTKDNSSIVILGIFADNVLRNVNQYRYFLTGGEKLGLKPRFVLRDNILTVSPLPKLSYSEFRNAVSNPQNSIWQHEFFLPDTDYGPTIWRFPYTLSLTRLLLSKKFRSLAVDAVRHVPSWIDFYKEGHPSRALETTMAIIEQFKKVADSRGKSALVILFPTPASFTTFKNTKLSVFDPLVNGLQKKGISVVDLTKDFAAHLQERNFCDIVTIHDACVGHFNPEGNRMVAAIVAHYIRLTNKLPKY
jgi:hypothetical protein